MPEYQFKFTDGSTDDRRQETLNELISFMKNMEGLTLSVVTLDEDQSEKWDIDGEDSFDYQDYYGKQIVQQVQEFDTEVECLVIRNQQHLPVAMANSQSKDSPDSTTSWQGIGVEKRLRTQIASMIGLDDYQLEEPL